MTLLYHEPTLTSVGNRASMANRWLAKPQAESWPNAAANDKLLYRRLANANHLFRFVIPGFGLAKGSENTILTRDE